MKTKFSGKKKVNNKIVIKRYQDMRVAFNLSFLTNDRKYNFNSSKCTKELKANLLDKMTNLSSQDKMNVLIRGKRGGIERIENPSKLKLRVHNVFKKTRQNDCDNAYWVFRFASGKCRVMGMFNDDIFYVLGIDYDFSLYDYGS